MQDLTTQYFIFQKIQHKWDNAQEALDAANVIVQIRKMAVTIQIPVNIKLKNGKCRSRKLKNIIELLPPALNLNFPEWVKTGQKNWHTIVKQEKQNS